MSDDLSREELMDEVSLIRGAVSALILANWRTTANLRHTLSIMETMDPPPSLRKLISEMQEDADRDMDAISKAGGEIMDFFTKVTGHPKRENDDG